MARTPGLLPPQPRQSAIVYETVDALAQDPGPQTDIRYAVVLELGPQIFKWHLYASDDADDINIVEPSGGASGRWKRARFDDRGADLTDASVTLLVSGGRTRVLPATTLSANRTLTLGTTGAVDGDEILVVRNDVGAYTVTIVNGGAGAGNVGVMPVSARAWCLARFDETNWIHVQSALSLGTS
jgi:hypothetical protein